MIAQEFALLTTPGIIENLILVVTTSGQGHITVSYIRVPLLTNCPLLNYLFLFYCECYYKFFF